VWRLQEVKIVPEVLVTNGLVLKYVREELDVLASYTAADHTSHSKGGTFRNM
jgi:hypothetical protein